MLWHLICTSSDTVETYFDSHVDLLQRKLQKHSDKLKSAAEEASAKIKDMKIKDISGDVLAENFERELKSIKIKVGPISCGVAALTTRRVVSVILIWSHSSHRAWHRYRRHGSWK